MDKVTLTATIISAIIAGIFGIITKFLEILFEKKLYEIEHTITVSGSGINKDGTKRNSKIDKFKAKFPWLWNNMRKLSTGGFIVTGIIIVGIIVMAVSSGGAGDTRGDGGLTVAGTEDALAITDTSVSSDAENFDSHSASVATIVFEEGKKTLTAFAVSHEDKVYFVTTFQGILDFDSPDYHFNLKLKSGETISSEHISLVGYSALKNIAVLRVDKQIDIAALNLDGSSPEMGEAITVIGADSTGNTIYHATKSGFITDNNVFDSATDLLRFRTDTAIRNFEGAPVFSSTSRALLGIALDGDEISGSLILPKADLSDILEEMSRTDSGIKEMKIRDIREAFPYAKSFSDSGDMMLFIGKDDLRLETSIDGSFFGNLKTNPNGELTAYGLSAENINNAQILMNHDDMIWLTPYGTDPDSSNYTYSYYKDYNINFDKQFLVVYPYSNSYMISFMSPDNVMISHVPRLGYSIQLDINSLWAMYAKEETVTYQRYNSDMELVETSSWSKDNTDSPAPEGFTLTVNEGGYQIRLIHNDSGAEAFIKDDGSYGVLKGDVSGGTDTDGNNIFQKTSSDDIDNDNMKAVLSLGSSDVLIGVTMQYSSIEDNEAKITYDSFGKAIKWFMQNGDKSTTVYENGDIERIEQDTNRHFFYRLETGSLLITELDSNKGIYINEENYIIGRFDKNGNLIGDTYPFLLDYRDIPDSTE
jgi:hypothetical protein